MAGGAQFAHVETYSRKGDKSGRTVDFVLGEAARRPEACLHVARPKLPEIVYGRSIEEVAALHDSHCASASNMQKNAKSRAIRKDQQTLGTVILSHPYTVANVESDPAKMAEVRAWEMLSIRWLKKQYGDDLVSVVRHRDEKQCHLHCFLLPMTHPGFKAAHYHVGLAAKRQVMADARTSLTDEGYKALNRKGDRAYKEALRAWQSDFHEKVAQPAGLTRLGPSRRRLTRAQWQSEKSQAEALERTTQRAQKLKASGDQFISKAKTEADAIRAAANKEREAAAQARASALAAKAEAQKAQEAANEAVSNAARYLGLSGRLRALWDGLRRSKVAATIRREFSGEIDHAKAFARSVLTRLKEEEKRRIAAERKAHEASRDAEAARDAALRASIERDRAWSLIPPERRQEITAMGPAMKMALRPSASHDKG